jgi:hypothetical protein
MKRLFKKSADRYLGAISVELSLRNIPEDIIERALHCMRNCSLSVLAATYSGLKYHTGPIGIDPTTGTIFSRRHKSVF